MNQYYLYRQAEFAVYHVKCQANVTVDHRHGGKLTSFSDECTLSAITMRYTEDYISPLNLIRDCHHPNELDRNGWALLRRMNCDSTPRLGQASPRM